MNLKISLFQTPLHRAAFSGHIECVQSLLDAGADVTAINVSGEKVCVKNRECE